MNTTFKFVFTLSLILNGVNAAFGMSLAQVLDELDNNLPVQIDDLACLQGDNTIYTTFLHNDRHLMVKRYVQPFSNQPPLFTGSIEVNRSWPHATTYKLPTEKCYRYFKILAAEHEKRNQKRQ
jgi:hypothetical protein